MTVLFFVLYKRLDLSECVLAGRVLFAIGKNDSENLLHTTGFLIDCCYGGTDGIQQSSAPAGQVRFVRQLRYDVQSGICVAVLDLRVEQRQAESIIRLPLSRFNSLK